MPGQLHRGHPHTAGAGVDQHPLPGLTSARCTNAIYAVVNTAEMAAASA